MWEPIDSLDNRNMFYCQVNFVGYILPLNSWGELYIDHDSRP